LTPTEAHYVLTRLLAEGRIRARHIADTLKARAREIEALRERLASLESMGATRPRRGRPPGRSSKRGAPRRRKLSSKVRALRRLQGRYMGLVRRLNPAQKAKVKAIREKKGLPAAIRHAASLSGRSA
jgi:hypothetical protein